LIALAINVKLGGFTPHQLYRAQPSGRADFKVVFIPSEVRVAGVSSLSLALFQGLSLAFFQG